MGISKISNTVPALGGMTWRKRVISSDSADKITTTSTKKLSELDVLTGYGTYLVLMGALYIINNPDSYSLYVVYYANDGTLNFLSSIKEGVGNLAVYMNSSGVVKRKTDSFNSSSIIAVCKIN